MDNRVRQATLLSDVNCLSEEISDRLIQERKFTIVDTDAHLITMCRAWCEDKVYAMVECKCVDNEEALDHLVRVLLPSIGHTSDELTYTSEASSMLDGVVNTPGFEEKNDGEWFSPDTFAKVVDPQGLRTVFASNTEVFVIAPNHPAAMSASASAGIICRGVRAKRDIPTLTLLSIYDSGGVLVSKAGSRQLPDEVRMYMMGHGQEGDVLGLTSTIGSPFGNSFGPLMNSFEGTGRQANAFAFSACVKSGGVLAVRHLIASKVDIKCGDEILLDYGPMYNATFLGIDPTNMQG